MKRFLFFLFWLCTSVSFVQGQSLGGTAKAQILALDGKGVLWILGMDFAIYHYQKNTWQEHLSHEKCRNISVSASGTLYSIGYDSKIYRSKDAKTWESITPKQLSRQVTADASGKMWMIGFDEKIYSFDNGKWIEYPGEGRAKELIVSANGTPYHIGKNDKVYVGTGNGWQELACPKARRIASDAFGKLWVVSMDYRLFYPPGKSLRWVEYPEKLKVRDVAVGNDNIPYYIAYWNNNIYKGKIAVR